MTNKYAYSGIHTDSKVTLDESGRVVYPQLGKKRDEFRESQEPLLIIDPSHIS